MEPLRSRLSRSMVCPIQIDSLQLFDNLIATAAAAARREKARVAVPVMITRSVLLKAASVKPADPGALPAAESASTVLPSPSGLDRRVALESRCQFPDDKFL
jgi:hypothetical protein